MGSGYKARCLDCGTKFMVNEGSGMFTYILRCDKCGEETGIYFQDIDDLFSKYAKLLPGPYCVAIGNDEDYDAETQAVIKEFRELVEKKVRKCKCGGSFTFFAPHRCPRCGSTRFEDTQTKYINFD